MNWPKGKIKRVFLEFEDGTAELKGLDAEAWQKMVHGHGGLAWAHGYEAPDLPWDVKLEEPTDEAE